jgi:GNAT superfamily N-acetyltransferase
MILEKTKISDLKKMAKCHKSAFPNSLSSKLGILFIKKMLSWYIIDQRGVIFHISENNRIIGYCGGIIFKEAGLSGAATSITQFCFKTLIFSYILRPWLIFHSDNFKRISFIKRNVFLKMGLVKNENSNYNIISSPKTPFQPLLGLVVIGVDSKFQGKGIGSVLLMEFERLAKIDKVHKIYLSVKSKNIQAIKVYEKNGWIKGSRNEDSLTMYKEL